MCTALTPANSVLFGNTEHLSVSRALSELQARRPIRVEASGEVLFALPVEGLDDQRLNEFVALCSPNAPELIVTQQRARAIGIEASTPMALPLPEGARARDIFAPPQMLKTRVILQQRRKLRAVLPWRRSRSPS
jgi:GTP cyclohydrolase II